MYKMRPSAMTMGRTTGTAVLSPAVLAINLMFLGMLYPTLAQELKVTTPEQIHKSEVGTTTNISCTANLENAQFAWKFQGKEIKDAHRVLNQVIDVKDFGKSKVTTLIIADITAKDAGNYTCEATMDAATDAEVILLDPSFEGKVVKVRPIEDRSHEVIVSEEKTTVKLNMTSPDHVNVTIECIFEVYEPREVNWYQINGKNISTVNPKPNGNITRQVITTEIATINKMDDNGTYVCEMHDSVSGSRMKGTIDILYCDKPRIMLEPPISISKSEVYLNWTVKSNNANIYKLYLLYRPVKASVFWYYPEKSSIHPLNRSIILPHLNDSTTYEVTVRFESDYGNGNSPTANVTTLDKNPEFIPQITINGFSATSVTIGWEAPPENLLNYIHYYILEATNKNDNSTREACHTRGASYLPYMFDNLAPHSTYIFKVRACFYYGKEKCGPWSDKMEAATLDGVPSQPSEVVVNCGTYNMSLDWKAPTRPNAEIKGYTMELTGIATFRDRFGNTTVTTWGPLSKFTTNDSFRVRLDDLQPNTQYTVKLSAMTRTRRRGEEAVKNCNTTQAPPDHPPRPRWRKIVENDKFMFKIYMPRLSERNGPICCYRVYMVRLLPHTDWSKNMQSPKDLPVLEYKDVHGQPPTFGAYITDIFTNDNFPPESELVLGDNKPYYDKKYLKPHCDRCLMKPEKKPVFTTVATTTVPSTTPFVADEETVNTEDPSDLEEEPEPAAKRQSADNNAHKVDVGPLVDGPLDPTANYSLFVEIIPDASGADSLFTNYMNSLMPAATPVAPRPSTPVEIALQATCAVAALVLLLMLVFCVRQTRRSRKMPPHAHLELNPLQVAYRYLFPGLGGRQQMVPTAPPDMAPIAKEDLAAAYAERQADSDYGFQKEFEMLPECYPDRTTHASEARENQPKNRYPDIKAYDQTRVKLSQIDSINGSDYINANYVMGYQERKRFICAQGPTDTTVNDFWRMIWEQGLELIVMLTNLEEYSKVKCSKYWPDADRGARAFGGITVHHVSEKRYSDYIVRELRITKQPLSADGQPIIENNGISKRNGDCKEAAEGSVPTSPREVKDSESRIVKQYHFLMWKDFAAPEHAYSILKFIKRVNEAWAAMVSRVCVVHCSAGVGRTGTLVALDCLLQQLAAHGHAAVFNTVAELRRQRNFLVQSLKQYVFVYRALVEFAHYGDTEIPAFKLKSSIDKLRNTPPGAANCLMEIEFEKILNCPIPEPLKSCAAGAADELRSKNRSQEILPYDRNRVILAPIPTRDYSTYINASFIEAYDNSEGFIITQDPLPTTIMDFWRMVSEHNVSTIVMLSELGEGKCPRYWDDGSAQYEHISVQYEESESCPYYTRRQFRAVNTKSGAAVCVRQLQYQGWPTAVGAVPEVTRGLAELADAAAPPASATPSAMLVHCQLGTERSSLFVALCILICQLRTERRVDVCCAARKVRSQRACTIDTFLHYEFLHRAILNYAELHNLLEDS